MHKTTRNKFIFRNSRVTKEKKKFTLFFVWLLSYVLILLIPIISFLGGIYAYEKNYSRHIDQFHSSLVSATTSGIREILIDINELRSMLLLHNSNIAEVLSIDRSNMYYGSKGVINFVSDLAVYKTYKSNIDFMFVYIEETDIVIHETGAYDSRYFYNIYFSGTVPYEEWKEQLCQSNRSNGKYYSTQVRINDNVRNTVCFGQYLSPSSLINSPLHSSLFIMVDEENFFRSIDVGIDYCDTYVFDSRGNTLLYNLKTGNPIIPKNLRELTSLVHNASLKMQNLSFQTTEMTVALLIPTKLLNDGLISSRMIVIGLAAICLALAALLITYFMKKNYSPLDSIMMGLNIPKSDSRSEIDLLSERIKQLFTSNTALSDTLSAQSSLLHDLTLTQLLGGNHGSAVNLSGENDYLSEFIHKNFAVVIFSWDALDNMFDDPTISNEEKLNEIYFIIKNIFEELFTDENSLARVVSYEGKPVCIINTDGENDIHEKAAYGCEFIEENFFVEINFSFSAYCDSIEKLSDAFSEAKQSIKRKKFYDTALLMSADAIDDSEQPPASLSEKTLKYVLENYADPGLGVNAIAAHFAVSSFYLSKVFKASYKHTLVDFIHEYRLEKAKELIKTNQYSFAEISEILGYNHIRTFNRVFKKYIGATPSEYKKSIT